jgi:hypothetical protein
VLCIALLRGIRYKIFEKTFILLNNITVTCMSDYRRGLGWLIRFIDWLHIVTTSNYSAIANSHTLQITTTRTKSS